LVRRSLILLLVGPALVVGAVVLPACGERRSSTTADGRARVVAALYPLAEAARHVGGDAVDVVDLTPAGAEPHDLELTTKQVDRIEDAKVVFVMGRGFQPAVEDAADRRDGPTVRILDALHVDRNAHDPHVWLDPRRMREIVDVVESSLAEADPAHAATYAANARRYSMELAALDRETATKLSHCAREQIVTSHAAFGWFAKRYGLEQHAVAGLSPDEEPSAERIAELSDLAERDGVTTIFTETLVSPKLAQTLAREAGGLRTETLDPLEGLSDEKRKAGDDYLSVMRDNVSALRRALSCT
jgi:zinc transport system substrate-binding protein